MTKPIISQVYHVHTDMSDGAHSLDAVVNAAIQQGIEILGISDHSNNPYSLDYCMDDDMDAYRRAVLDAKARYADRITVLCGIEQESFSGKVSGFDYSIGSVHLLPTPEGYADVDHTAAVLRDTVNRWFDGDFYRYTKAYYEQVALVRERTDCTIIGHFDLVAKFNEKEHFFDENDRRYREPALEAIDALCARPDAVFEINTGALVRGARKVPYPDVGFLQYIREKGGYILFSSDSHHKDTLLEGADRMITAAKTAGFTERVIIQADGTLTTVAI